MPTDPECLCINIIKIHICWPDDNPIDGLKHVVNVVLTNIYQKNVCVFTVIKTIQYLPHTHNMMEPLKLKYPHSANNLSFLVPKSVQKSISSIRWTCLGSYTVWTVVKWNFKCVFCLCLDVWSQNVSSVKILL
jgi:hypothetical protein